MSGGHINPSVYVEMAALKKINSTQLFGYLVAQCLGALFAVFIFKIVK